MLNATEAHKRRRGFSTPKVVQVVLQPFEKQAEGNIAGFTHGSKDQSSQLWLATPGDIDANVVAHRHSWARGTIDPSNPIIGSPFNSATSISSTSALHPAPQELGTLGHVE